VDEFLELPRRAGGLLGGNKAIQNQQIDLASAYFAPQCIVQAFQALGLENAKSAEIRYPVRDQRFVEKSELADVPEHATVGLCKKRHIKCTAATGRMVEAQLVSQNRFSGARGAENDVDASS
jgi:hypothetical protein